MGSYSMTPLKKLPIKKVNNTNLEYLDGPLLPPPPPPPLLERPLDISTLTLVPQQRLSTNKLLYICLSFRLWYFIIYYLNITLLQKGLLKDIQLTSRPHKNVY